MIGLTLSVGDRRVGAIYSEVAEPIATLVFGHGAGGDMHHRTMKAISEAFSGMGIATMRFNFPFKEDGLARLVLLTRSARAASAKNISKTRGGAEASNPLSGTGAVF